MSRIRSIHPGLWTDEAFMSLSAYGRLLLIGLWTEAFDDGVFEWKPLTLKAKLFPVDAIDVSELLLDLVEAGVIARLDSQPKQPGVIRNFQRFQRPKKPNSSGMLPDEWRDYVGASSTEPASSEDSSEPVPHQFPTSTEKSTQMEDGGGKREDEEQTRPPVLVSEARALFDELWSAFPHNPTSSEAKAEAAFSATKAEDRASILAAARRYQQWFAEDNAARDRTETAGLRYVPHLAKWIEDGAWRDAGKLAVKSDAIPTVPMVRLDRVLDADLFAACETVRGKSAPSSPWSFSADVVEQARQAMAEQSNSGAVH